MVDVLNLLQNESSKNKKLELLKNNTNNSELADILDATFNRSRIFHIKKFNVNPSNVNKTDHESFIDLLHKLENRDIKGNEAVSAVESFLSQCDEDTAKWYARAIRKDLKCGFSAKTAVKAGFKIPVFDVMLAKDGKQQKNLEDLVERGVWVSPKLDGYRCLAIVNNGVVTLLSRNGTEYDNFPNIAQSLKSAFPTGRYIFDGEIMSDDFQAMQKSAFANKRKTTVGDVHFAVFGYIDYNEWMSQKFVMKTKQRLEMLDSLSNSFKDNVVKVDQQFTKSLTVIYRLQSKWEQAGYEGAMVLPDVPYYLGRKTGKLLKFKSMHTQDCIVTDMYEGKPGTRLEGKMGGVIIVQENGEVCECGTGWTDDDRETMWNNKDLYIGGLIEVKYQELTKDGIMRFPVFMRWRNDKDDNLCKG